MSSLTWDLPTGSMGKFPLIGILNGKLGEPEPWNMALDTLNTLREAGYNLPCKATTAMGVFCASQQAYRIPMAPEGTDININYFLCITTVMISKL